MLPSRVSTRARPSPFHRCPTRPSGKGSTRRAARCPASFRVLSRPADTTSSALKRQRPDAGFAKEKSPVLVGQNRAQSTEDKAPRRERAASRQLAQGMSRGSTSICFSKRTSFQSRPPTCGSAWSRWFGRRRPSKSGSHTRASGSSRSCLPKSSTARNRLRERSGTRSSAACARICRPRSQSTLASRPLQRGRQSLPLLIPSGHFGVRSLLQRLGLGPDGRRPVGVLPLRPVQCGLRLVDGLLAALTLLLPGSLFLRLFALAALPLPFVGEGSPVFRGLVGGPASGLLRFPFFRLAWSFLRFPADAQLVRQLGVLVEGTDGSDGPFENDAGLRHGRCDHVRIFALLCRALVE